MSAFLLKMILPLSRLASKITWDRSFSAGKAELYAASAAGAGTDKSISTKQKNTAMALFIDKTPPDDVSYFQPRSILPRGMHNDLMRL